jgi:hypothetical protein
MPIMMAKSMFTNSSMEGSSSANPDEEKMDSEEHFTCYNHNACGKWGVRMIKDAKYTFCGQMLCEECADLLKSKKSDIQVYLGGLFKQACWYDVRNQFDKQVKKACPKIKKNPDKIDVIESRIGAIYECEATKLNKTYCIINNLEFDKHKDKVDTYENQAYFGDENTEYWKTLAACGEGGFDKYCYCKNFVDKSIHALYKPIWRLDAAVVNHKKLRKPLKPQEIRDIISSVAAGDDQCAHQKIHNMWIKWLAEVKSKSKKYTPKLKNKKQKKHAGKICELFHEIMN